MFLGRFSSKFCSGVCRKNDEQSCLETEVLWSPAMEHGAVMFFPGSALPGIGKNISD